MERNLSDRERKQRLGLSGVFAIISVILYFQEYHTGLVAGSVLLSLGFAVNYFTCFCTAKKAVMKLKQAFK